MKDIFAGASIVASFIWAFSKSHDESSWAAFCAVMFLLWAIYIEIGELEKRK